MKLTNWREVEGTRKKLAMLESDYRQAKLREMSTLELKEMTLFSIRRMINQMKEDISRFECDVKAGRIPDEMAHTTSE